MTGRGRRHRSAPDMGTHDSHRRLLAVPSQTLGRRVGWTQTLPGLASPDRASPSCGWTRHTPWSAAVTRSQHPFDGVRHPLPPHLREVSVGFASILHPVTHPATCHGKSIERRLASGQACPPGLLMSVPVPVHQQLPWLCAAVTGGLHRYSDSGTPAQTGGENLWGPWHR